MRHLILASTSRYRRELLARLDLPFDVVAPEVEERAIEGEAPATMAARLALAKARNVVATDAVIIGSDQVASLEGRLLRKPGNARAAVDQLQACQGKAVVFHTAVVVLDSATGSSQQHVDRTEVWFATLARTALERYVQLEEPYDCAGSFKAEGLGVVLFDRIDSSDPTALIGLPLIWVAAALRAVGLDPLGAAAPS
jgi:septum formation protein